MKECMKECMKVRSGVAYQQCDVVSENERCPRWGSEELRDVIEQWAKYVAVCHIPLMKVVMKTKAQEIRS